MAQILRTVLTPAQALATSVETFNFDLPVNPLSAILVTIRALNNTTTIGNFSGFGNLFAKLTNARVSFRGASILDGDPFDLAILNGLRAKWWWKQGQLNSTDNDVRSLTFPLLFGHQPYDPRMCFPASRRGDMVLTLDTATDPAGLDNYALHLETIELLDAIPEKFLKVTTAQRTMQLGAANDVELPIGNKLLGILLRANTFPTAASRNASFGEVALEVDNVEVMFSRTDWEGLQGEISRLGGDWVQMAAHTHHLADHIHLIDLAANATDPVLISTALGLIDASVNDSALFSGTGTATTGHTGIQPPAITQTLQAENDNGGLQRYAYMDLDPLMDGQFALDTRGAARVNLAITSDVADGATSRVLTIEEIDTAAGVGGATP